MTKLLSLLTGLFSSASTYVYVIGAAACFAAGGYVAHLHYVAEIESITNKMQQIALEKEKEYVQKTTEMAGKIRAHTDRISVIERDNSELIGRLQQSKANLDRATRSAKGAVAAEHERCRNLLFRGSELSRRGCELLGKCAVEKDAISTLLK